MAVKNRKQSRVSEQLNERQVKLKKLAKKHPHLKEHLEGFRKKEGDFPEFVENPEEEDHNGENIVYKVSDVVFVHNYAKGEEDKRYYSVEPEISEGEKELYNQVKKELFNRTMSSGEVVEKMDEEEFKELYHKVVPPGGSESGGVLDKLKNNTQRTFDFSKNKRKKFWYNLKKEIIGLGPLDPLLKDRNNEDIHVLGYTRIDVDHKVFGIMETDVDLGTKEEYKRWLKSVTERIGHPVSDSNPIVDATLPDGSRLNIVFSDDVSVEGPSITIRQFEEDPLSIFNIVEFGTMSPELVAYLWICLEAGASVGVCGETASGKTTSMNAMTKLIPEESKIYSAEDTLEVRPPHDTWQRLLTSESTGGGADVDLYDLITTALRSRPDYVLVGEVRGREARNVFNAMQTGHPVMFTFHAGNVSALINRFTGDPINVPEKFFDNLNIAVFQNFIKTGDKELRRVTAVQEIEGYSDVLDGLVTRKVFERNIIEDTSELGESVLKDEIKFVGYNNSYFLEEKAAPHLGFNEPSEIYDELDKRADIVRKAISEGYTDWDESLEIIRSYEKKGLEGLPFEL